jgi:hypothetical protein
MLSVRCVSLSCVDCAALLLSWHFFLMTKEQTRTRRSSEPVEQPSAPLSGSQRARGADFWLAPGGARRHRRGRRGEPKVMMRLCQRRGVHVKSKLEGLAARWLDSAQMSSAAARRPSAALKCVYSSLKRTCRCGGKLRLPPESRPRPGPKKGFILVNPFFWAPDWVRTPTPPDGARRTSEPPHQQPAPAGRLAPPPPPVVGRTAGGGRLATALPLAVGRAVVSKARPNCARVTTADRTLWTARGGPAVASPPPGTQGDPTRASYTWAVTRPLYLPIRSLWCVSLHGCFLNKQKKARAPMRRA